MEEKNLNFDEVIDRRNTDCLKFDFAERRGKPADVLPLWVADMDFKTSSLVLDALTERVQHGIFGYTESRESYFEAVSKWMEAHHDWKVERSWLTKTPGVVFALAMAVKAYSKAGDAVLIQQPVYYPFSEVIRDNNRKLVSNDLVLGDDGNITSILMILRNRSLTIMLCCSCCAVRIIRSAVYGRQRSLQRWVISVSSMALRL